MNIDAFAIGEHHRKDFAVSASEIVLAAAASKTKQIHLSTINPIRVYEQYATIDAIAPKLWLVVDHSLKPLIYLAMI